MRRIVCVKNVVRDVAVRALAAAFAYALMAAGAFAQDPIPGSLHTSPSPGFASGSLPIGLGNDFAYAVVIQPDGKIVLAGFCFNGSNDDFCVTRLNPDGTLDASFDGPGGNGNGKFLLPIGTGSDYARALALQPDGKIVLTGSCSNGINDDFCVARLNADGTLDTSFDGPGGGGNGKVLLPIGSNDNAYAVAIQPDGKIVLAGYCWNGSNSDFCVARLNADGSLDANFDGPSGTGDGKFLLPIGSGQDRAKAVTLQPDGKILIAGYCHNGANEDFCAARLNVDGTLDTSFDGPSGFGNGTFLLPVGTGDDLAFALALQPDGKIVLAGTCLNGANNDFCVARLHTDGTLDETFDGASGTGNGKFLLPIGTGTDYAFALALQPDGKVVLAGFCAAVDDDFCIARLNPDGTLDSTFDGPLGTGNGKFLIPISPGNDVATALALQPDGRIVLAGYCTNGGNNDFCVARLNGGPFGAKHCTTDFDGDGKVLATTDMLIGARVALGMTGSSVVSGISFALHATRKTWPPIRDYLVTQCGMVIAP